MTPPKANNGADIGMTKVSDYEESSIFPGFSSAFRHGSAMHFV